MPQYPQRFWLAAFVVAWSVDFLFWNKPVGISFAILAVLLLVAGFVLASVEKKQPARLSFLLSGLVVITALVTVLRGEPFTRFINALLAFVALGLLVLTFYNGAWVHYRLLNYLGGGFELLIAGLSRAAGLRLAPKPEEGGAGRTFWRRSLPVLRGVLLAAPVVLILGALLSSADLVFADQLKHFFKLFDLSHLPEYLFRLFYILILTYLLAGLYFQAVYPIPLLSAAPRPQIPAVTPAADAAGPVETAQWVGSSAEQAKPASRGMRFLGAIETFIILGSVDLLFAFFVAIQFRYFFGGQANISVAGYTYSDYARRGFFELVLVAVISLLLYLVLNAITWREKPAQERWFTGLSVLLVGLVWVILASAFQRLLLYEAAYGFTRLRTYTHIFIPWLGFLLLATIILQILHRERYFGALMLLTTFGFALTFGVMNIDGFIVRQNVARAQEGYELDSTYLLGLSDDALPAITSAFQSPETSGAVRHKLGMVLACRVYQLGSEEPQSWQSYHPGSALSRQSLVSLDLSPYPVRLQQGQPVIDVGTGWYSCIPRSTFD